MLTNLIDKVFDAVTLTDSYGKDIIGSLEDVEDCIGKINSALVACAHTRSQRIEDKMDILMKQAQPFPRTSQEGQSSVSTSILLPLNRSNSLAVKPALASAISSAPVSQQQRGTPTEYNIEDMAPQLRENLFNSFYCFLRAQPNLDKLYGLPRPDVNGKVSHVEYLVRFMRSHSWCRPTIDVQEIGEAAVQTGSNHRVDQKG